MQTVSLQQFVRLATPYERWRTDLNPTLKTATIISGISIATSLTLALLLPNFSGLAESGLFLVLGGTFSGILYFLLESQPLLIGLNLISLLTLGFLVIATSGLKAGKAAWHWVAMIEIIVGAFDAFVIAFQVAIIVINIVVWILLICLGILILSAIAGSAGR